LIFNKRDVRRGSFGRVQYENQLRFERSSGTRRPKATFFAVLASFKNLALSASQLATKYLNQLFIVTREVKGPAGAVQVPADYSELGILLVTATVLGFVLPMLAILFVKSTRFRSA
jgi:hypothetical protein